MKYVESLAKAIDLPEEAAAVCGKLCPVIAALPDYPVWKNAYFNGGEVAGPLKEAAAGLGVHHLSVWLAFTVLMSAETRTLYAERGWDEDVWRDTCYDITIWEKVCRRDCGEVGLRQFDWLHALMSGVIVRLGRLEFHTITYHGPDFEAGGYSVHKGDTVINMHIPEGDSLTKEKRMDSYRRAYAFWGKKINTFVCESYLLYPAHEEFLPKTSNILDFMHDFHLHSPSESHDTGCLWRIFDGSAHDWSDYDSLPRRTGLQRAYADHLKATGGLTGGAEGVFFFDGENIIK